MMKINELAKAGGIHLETIRYYEKIGLLPPPQRTANGYRSYDEHSLSLLHFIKVCRSLGFSIEEIKQLNQLKSKPDAHYQADRIILRHLAKVEEKIKQLSEIKQFLQGLATESEHSEKECKAIAGLEQQQSESSLKRSR